MKRECAKCGEVFETDAKDYYVDGETFEGIDDHHNPPEEISRFLKTKWEGELIPLCRKCHTKLHDEITLILKKYSFAPRYNSDYWLMKNSTIQKISDAKKEIYEFTKKWVAEK